MLSLEFIIVWTLLLGCAMLLMQPIWEQNEKWEMKQQEWDQNEQLNHCTTNQLLANNRFVVWKNTCSGIETLEGWDSNHYA